MCKYIYLSRPHKNKLSPFGKILRLLKFLSFKNGKRVIIDLSGTLEKFFEIDLLKF